MPTRPGPTVQRRRLGIELRRLREAAGKSIDEVARVLECSTSKISRIENGQVAASPRDVRDMLEMYDVDSAYRDSLVETARVARHRSWWQAYSDTPAMPVIGLEVAADQIQSYEAMVVPGLLQTRDYARAMISALYSEMSNAQVDRWVELRMTRQELLTRRNPPMVQILLEECVLRRPVGGRSIMRAQLEHLASTVAAAPSLALQILPLSVGAHAAMNGPFAVFRFPDPAVPDVVFFEHAVTDLFLETPEHVERYGRVFENLSESALDPSESDLFLTRLIEEQ
jgi:transcriptional regulator with XRE-family HTH domain